MSNDIYLNRLTSQLVDALERVSPEVRDRHVEWLRSQQNPDGGFSGREGGSDLYYTAFALRSLAVLQGLTPELCGRCSAFLNQKSLEPTSIIDLFSLLISSFLATLGGGTDFLAEAQPGWEDRMSLALERFRKLDGGYAKSVESVSGSTYHTFLVLLTLQLLGRTSPHLDDLVRFTRSRQRDDGGFVEVAPMRRSGTNPTAAAVGILQMCGALDSTTRRSVVHFLTRLPSSFEGGFRANDRIPAADLLSTFTGCWTLHQLDALDEIDRVAIREYAESCELPTGGFRGGLWDEGFDVEYTFYGLGVLGLCAVGPDPKNVAT